LHIPTKTENEVESQPLLDVVVQESVTIQDEGYLQQLAAPCPEQLDVIAIAKADSEPMESDMGCSTRRILS